MSELSLKELEEKLAPGDKQLVADFKKAVKAFQSVKGTAAAANAEFKLNSIQNTLTEKITPSDKKLLNSYRENFCPTSSPAPTPTLTPNPK